MTQARFALLALALAACSKASGTTTPTSRPAAATNTSIATATPLPEGGRGQFTLPCEGAVYFGPFDFTDEGQEVHIASSARSLAGGQVCGGGAWVDGDDGFVATSGVGCAQDADVADGRIDYTYQPSAGDSTANPIYLKLEISEPRPATCDDTLVVDLSR